MFSKNKYFLGSICLVSAQQIALGLSTWFIAKAGAYVALTETVKAVESLSYFFISAVAGYCLSSCAALLTVRTGNSVWEKYIHNVTAQMGRDIAYANNKNKQRYESWLIGEAHDTIAQSSVFYVQLTSIALNVVFTLIVFYVTLGQSLTLIVCGGMMLAALFSYAFKKNIEFSATDIQNGRTAISEVLGPLWDANLFGSRALYSAEEASLHRRLDHYFKSNFRYSKIEQLVACTPILLSVIALLFYLQIMPEVTPLQWGALIAVLPRTLQLFGSIHGLIVLSTQGILIRKRLTNLESFVSTLPTRNLEQSLELDNISIVDTATNEKMDFDALRQKAQSEQMHKGRILITGKNGAGKSTLLMLLKKDNPDALMLSPVGPIFSISNDMSSGQTQLVRIGKIMENPSPLILLDEWDANLDKDNLTVIDRLVASLSKRSLVVEVRHRSSLSPSNPKAETTPDRL